MRRTKNGVRWEQGHDQSRGLCWLAVSTKLTDIGLFAMRFLSVSPQGRVNDLLISFCMILR